MITNEMLLIFFALPIAVIIISIALQRIFRCPILVAAIIFAIFLIVTFIIDNLTFLIATIAYAILSYLTALLTCVINRFLNSCNSCNSASQVNTISNDFQQLNNNQNNENDINTISNNVQNNNCGCSNNEVSGINGVSARINVIPNNNGTSGNITGCYRRRQF